MSSSVTHALMRFAALGACAGWLVSVGAVPATAHTTAKTSTPAKAARARAKTSGFRCPVGPGGQVTNSYGDARGGGRRHQGIDIMAPYGTPIYAVEPGVILRAYSNRRGGLSISLRANSGVEYFYAHQSANLVKSGQKVAAGQIIGRVGTSGNAAGKSPHLHFEKLLPGRRPVDPYAVVKAACG
jgi:peptidoglycan LD-endopeptidase LytH